MAMTLRARAMSGLRWIVCARLLAQVLTWAITLVVIRLLSPSDYGLLAMATIFVALLGMMSELGLGPAVVQSADISDVELRKVFGVVLATHLVLTGLLMVAAPAIALFFEEPRLVAVVRVLSLQFVIGAFSIMPSALLERRMEFRGRSLVDLATTVVGSLVVLALAVAGFGVWALVIGMLVTGVLKTVGINVLAPWWRWPQFSLDGMKSLLTYGGRITLVQFLWYLFNQADALIVGKWLGKEALGLYSVSMHVASMPNQRLSALINQIAFPTFARIQHDLAKVTDVLLMAVRVLGFIAFPLFWGISSVAPEIVAVVLGSRWGPAIAPLQLLALVMPLRLINTAVVNAVQGLGRADCVLRNVVFAVVLTPPILLAGTNWGLIGVSLAWLLSSPIVFVQNMMRNLPVTGVGQRQFWKSIAPNAGSALVMYGAVAGARELLPTGWPGWGRLVGLVLVGVVTFAAGAWLTNRRGAYEVLQLAREVLRPRRLDSAPT
jgi:O-antigen/teichoic acid export membrane protein